MLKRFRAAASAFVLFFSLGIAPTAQAEVIIYFYSRELGSMFPHAFVIVEGTVDATGQKVSGNYGFSPTAATPAMLLGSVKGVVQTLNPEYIAKSDRKFTLRLDDAAYARVMARVADWRGRKQPSYNLDKRNCVHFIMELAVEVGLKVNRQSKFFRKPRSFLEEVISLNPSLKK